MKPKVISTEKVYQGRIFDLSLIKLRDNDKEYACEIISHVGSAVIVPIFADNKVALVSQYRPAAGKYLIELPAGTVDKGETPKECAAREVKEEVGFRADKLEKIAEFYVSPGLLAEKMHVFVASGLIPSKRNLDDDEILSVEKTTFKEAYDKIFSGEIEDAKTIIGLTLAGKRIGFNS